MYSLCYYRMVSVECNPITVCQTASSSRPMSALCHKRTLKCIRGMSALPSKADITEGGAYVRFVPQADICRCGKQHLYSITSSARSRMDVGTDTPIALAVFKLSANSKLVGCSSGRSDGLAPLRSLATNDAARRNTGTVSIP